ncbi:MAG: hypothetical protein COB97_06880 [Paracoccus sp.]|nr:MAG: hypothetical protein COB97_06880 [Paracoccus sp. (in: a-proteobacteria)]
MLGAAHVMRRPVPIRLGKLGDDQATVPQSFGDAARGPKNPPDRTGGRIKERSRIRPQDTSA